MVENKYHTEVIDLPSEGKLYSKDSPLNSGKIEIKYMTAKEEDILTSQNLIKKGVVIEKLLDSLITTEGVSVNDLVVGDKNAVMIAARILAYGPEYSCEVNNPKTGNSFNHTFNLADCPFRKLPAGINSNSFELELPISKVKIKHKILTGKDEKMIDSEIDSIKKTGVQIIPELTTRLKYTIISIDGDGDRTVINSFVDSMLSRDSLFLRQSIAKNAPDIDLKQKVELEGEEVEVVIPMTPDFFWPDTTT
jgi:hypothetical protein